MAIKILFRNLISLVPDPEELIQERLRADKIGLEDSVRIKEITTEVEKELFENFYRINFRIKEDNSLDTKWSVYWVEPQELLRVVTEHYISLPSAPTQRDILILDGLGSEYALQDKKYGGTQFNFSNVRHREIPLTKETKSRQLADFIFKKIKSRTLSFNPISQIKLAANMIVTGDPEWVRNFDNKVFHHSWNGKIEAEIKALRENMS